MNSLQKKSELAAHVCVAVLLLVIFPLVLGPFWLGSIGKYMSFAFVAIGIVLAWGYCGILSLGQGIFFGLGGYMMAMFLKVEASAPNLPDFMVWSSVDHLPTWWQPFTNFWVTLCAIIVVPIVLSFPFAYLIFKKRVSGVYFAIVTISLALAMTVMIVGQQGHTGGENGITDFNTLLGFDILGDQSKRNIYFVEVGLLLVFMALSAWLLHTRFGKILIAVRDREDRVRFSGYDTAMIKAFIFAVAAVLSSVGGALFTLQVGLITPTLVGSVASVEMVIYAALGGRLSVPGAVIGALAVGFLKSYLSEQFPESWLFFLGAMFIIVVAFMPNGLAGTVQRVLRIKA
ncbi:urea ABC transporter permease subunit UrtC [Glaciimonas immobilis]|uniref:Urea transport system permease protein n=1 Tax=Glaciimonas immobilis TaxID=728004 RepID=A0A840RTW2_9BURK|nr:urea ABC transporter permease subunit UrtC [Glaciimonas immobilis]KAF3999862.1 urea ABC transporter permease subunit UrtC [Glaciimonas immobilis]MBB5200346.1 urea transport system permease protein [Glaciimonas immobilis]